MSFNSVRMLKPIGFLSGKLMNKVSSESLVLGGVSKPGDWPLISLYLSQSASHLNVTV